LLPHLPSQSYFHQALSRAWATLVRVDHAQPAPVGACQLVRVVGFRPGLAGDCPQAPAEAAQLVRGADCPLDRAGACQPALVVDCPLDRAAGRPQAPAGASRLARVVGFPMARATGGGGTDARSPGHRAHVRRPLPACWGDLRWHPVGAVGKLDPVRCCNRVVISRRGGLASPARFERTAPRVGILCSILLSYGDTRFPIPENSCVRSPVLHPRATRPSIG
jgi:hypothetical protein